MRRRARLVVVAANARRRPQRFFNVRREAGRLGRRRIAAVDDIGRQRGGGQGDVPVVAAVVLAVVPAVLAVVVVQQRSRVRLRWKPQR